MSNLSLGRGLNDLMALNEPKAEEQLLNSGKALNVENQEEEDKILTLKLSESKVALVRKLIYSEQKSLENTRKTLASRLVNLAERNAQLLELDIAITEQLINSHYTRTP